MPKIIIREQDLTTGGANEIVNYSVVIPGFRAQLYKGETDAPTTAIDNPFNSEGVYEVTSQKDFKNNIGFVDPCAAEQYGLVGHFGNQIAYLLLGLGYTVLYKDLGYTTYTKLQPGTITPISLYSDDAYKIADYYQILNNLTTEAFWEPLYDKGNYDFRFIITGLKESAQLADNVTITATSGKKVGGGDIADINANTIYKRANDQIVNVASCYEPDTNEIPGRGDCTALLDVDENAYIGDIIQSKIATDIQAWVKNNAMYLSANKINGGKAQYAALFAPTFCYRGLDTTDYTNVKFPAYMHYLTSFKFSLDNDFAEWFAIAGLTRGNGAYTIDGTSVVIGEVAMNKLQPRIYTTDSGIASVNTIIKIRNNYYLWGNRTAYKIDDTTDLIASHFLNIRQLCSTLKKQIYYACKKFSFDPNSDILWTNFCAAVRPTLEKMKGNQGITSYQFVKVATDKKATLKARVIIRPIEAVEDFDITVVLTDDNTVVVTE